MKQQLDPEIRKLVSLNNYEELHRHLLRLPWAQQVAIQLRFWEQYSIFQVAYQLGISWKKADDLIETAINNLKNELKKAHNNSTAIAA